MCTGCMTNADFLLTGGVVGAASMRVGARMLLSSPPRWSRRVSDAEADAFVSSLDTDPDTDTDVPKAQERGAEAVPLR